MMATRVNLRGYGGTARMGLVESRGRACSYGAPIRR